MKGFSKLHIKDAVQSHSKVDLSKNHITTMNFGQCVPIYCEELVPGDKFNVKQNVFARLAPLVVPTYSNNNLRFNTFATFVPYHQVWEPADSYLAGNVSFRGHSINQPYCTQADLFNFLDTKCFTNGSSEGYDYSYISSTGDTVYRTFTALGKFYFKVLRCLGYDLPRSVDYRTDSLWLSSLASVKLNLLPLLCYSHSWNSWLSQSTKTNTSELSSFLYDVKFGKDVTNKVTSGHFLYLGIDELLKHIKICYDNSYFTSAWESPNSPLNGVRIFNSWNTEDQVTLNITNIATSSNTPVQSQRVLDYLKRFDNWARRTNLAGSKEIEQIYSKFGIKIDDYKTRYPYKLGMSSTPIQIGDVTATADSNGVVLGEYAGKGILDQQCDYNFECHDYGMIITLGWISVKPIYYQGYNRSVLRTSPLDFYNPDLDGLQAQQVSKMELLGYTKNYRQHDIDNSLSFGFVPRYSEYLFPRDVISGDMLIYEGFKAWHLGRDMNSINFSNNLVAQSDLFCKMTPVDSEYSRIFNVAADAQEDPFIFTMYFDVNASRPMKSMSAKAELGEGDITIERNGSQTI